MPSSASYFPGECFVIVAAGQQSCADADGLLFHAGLWYNAVDKFVVEQNSAISTPLLQHRQSQMKAFDGS